MLIVAALQLAVMAGAMAETPSVDGSTATLAATANQSLDALIDNKLLLDYLAGKESFALIDVRSAEEYNESHINGAINIPYQQITVDPSLLPEDKSATILVYCRTGMRAGMAAASLSEAGYTDVRVLPARQLVFHDDLIVFNCGF